MIKNKLNVKIPLKEFFNQTLGQLAKSCENQSYLNQFIGDQGNES